MSRYMIHACNKRYWYVQEYLLPSLLNQGIAEDDVIVYLDNKDEGCLTSSIKSFESLKDVEGGTWHLQDDVIICSDFKQRTKQFEDEAIACGICTEYDAYKEGGKVISKLLWYSFPCMFVKNALAGEWAEWVKNTASNMELYKLFVKANKYDDTLFNEFIKTKYPDLKGYNIRPNLVNHIDYLIGYSSITGRGEIITALYWDEPELVYQLKQNLLKKDVDKH